MLKCIIYTLKVAITIYNFFSEDQRVESFEDVDDHSIQPREVVVGSASWATGRSFAGMNNWEIIFFYTTLTNGLVRKKHEGHL